MDIKKILNIGVGRCGNKITDGMMLKDKRYSGLFINTSLGDMNTLENYTNGRSSNFLIPNADGSGRDRDLAFEYAKANIQRIGDEMARFSQYEYFVVYFSTDGGTGSGCSPIVMKAIRKVFPNKKILAIPVMPPTHSSKVALENTIACWNDLMELRKAKIIDGLRIVDNGKRETLEEINECVINDLDSSFKLNTFDTEGVIDQRDSFRINTARDYQITLMLNNKIASVEEAIEEAKRRSVFVMPLNFDCDYLGMLLQKGRYSLTSARRLFNVYETEYVGHSDGRNIVVASGMNIPVDKIESIQQSLAEVNKKSRTRIKDDDFFVSETVIEREDPQSNINNEIKNTTAVTSDELDKLFNDDFWN